MKLCINCIHHHLHLGLHQCQRPSQISRVDGSVWYVDRGCSAERSGDLVETYMFGYCGKYGRFYKEKE